jgi:hypothetical protein
MCVTLNQICKLLQFISLRGMKLYIHTVFEPSAKKHLPFFSCFVKKKNPCFVNISMLHKEGSLLL